MLNPDHLYWYLAFIVLVGALICVLILRKQKQDREQKAAQSARKAEALAARPAPAQSPKSEPAKAAPAADSIDLTKALSAEELRLLTTDLGVVMDKVSDQQQKLVVSIVKDMIESTGHIAPQMLDLCIAAVQDTADSMASVFGLSMGGHNALLEKLKKLKEESL